MKGVFLQNCESSFIETRSMIYHELQGVHMDDSARRVELIAVHIFIIFLRQNIAKRRSPGDIQSGRETTPFTGRKHLLPFKL
jgi:hypothetical protein